MANSNSLLAQKRARRSGAHGLKESNLKDVLVNRSRRSANVTLNPSCSADVANDNLRQ